VPLCLEYDCNCLFLQLLAASEFLLLKDRELRSAQAGRPSLHPVVSNGFHKYADLVRHALGHTQLYYILLKPKHRSTVFFSNINITLLDLYYTTVHILPNINIALLHLSQT
jgi:hypothetical protein